MKFKRATWRDSNLSLSVRVYIMFGVSTQKALHFVAFFSLTFWHFEEEVQNAMADNT